MFQICDYLGIEEIAIVGQDGYNLERGKNHFNENYTDEASNFKKSNNRIIEMHKELKRYFNSKGIEIFNSSKDSILKNIYNFKDLKDFV